MLSLLLTIFFGAVVLQASHNEDVVAKVEAGKFSIPKPPTIPDAAVKQASSASILVQDHNTAAVTAMNRALKSNNPQDGGLTLGNFNKGTVTPGFGGEEAVMKISNQSVSTKVYSKVDVTVNSDGRIKSTTITHPTSLFGLSKPVTTIEHGENGVHTVTTKETGLFSWFSKPVTKTIIHNPVDKTVVETNDETSHSYNNNKDVSHHTLNAQGDIISSDVFKPSGEFIKTVVPNASGTVTNVSISPNGSNVLLTTGDRQARYLGDGTFLGNRTIGYTPHMEQGA